MSVIVRVSVSGEHEHECDIVWIVNGMHARNSCTVCIATFLCTAVKVDIDIHADVDVRQRKAWESKQLQSTMVVKHGSFCMQLTC